LLGAGERNKRRPVSYPVYEMVAPLGDGTRSFTGPQTNGSESRYMAALIFGGAVLSSISTVIMNPLVPLYSNALSPNR
jgi:hypothetical protein